jgi:non-specific serine/threonine protein kinase
MCIALGDFWAAGGHFAEGRLWLEGAVDRSAGVDSPELAEAHQHMAGHLRQSGDLDQAQAWATTSLDMWRRLGSHPHQLARALDTLAAMEMSRGRTDAARTLYEEALTIGREPDDTGDFLQSLLLSDLAIVEYVAGNYQRSLELHTQVLTIADQLGNHRIAMSTQHNMACALLRMGNAQEAQEQMCSLIPHVLESNEPNELMSTAEDYAAVLADLGDHHRALGLIGAADALREREASPRWPVQQAEVAETIAKTRNSLTSKQWDDAYQAGRNTTIENALSEAHTWDAAS